MSGEIGFLPDEASNSFAKIIVDIKKRMDLLLNQSDYGTAVKDLGIIPTIYPQWMLDKQKASGREIKERRLLRKGDVDYRLFIDHAKFLVANDTERRKLLVQNVISVIQDLKHRIPKNFDADRLERDIEKEYLEGK